jgi:Fe2+ or Zn2+ uptake regulation protein/O6-methylguanine-DNA--protein-cysteine methyltransferase
VTSEDVAHLLRSHELRVTPQRRAILNAFRGSSDEHLSAEEVLSRASLAVPELGRGTVYATLAELAELGLLGAVGNPEPVRYETNVVPHDHFRCRLCLRLFDVQFGGRELEGRELPGYVVDSVAVRAEGICAQCTDYERGLSDGAARVIEHPTLEVDAISALSCRRVPSPVGDLAVVASSDGIVRIAFEDHADFELLRERARRRRGPGSARGRATALTTAFTAYFEGDRNAAPDVIDWRLSPAERGQVLRAVQRIPYAEPCSYDRIMGGLPAYDCGFVMGANPLPLLVPCHRVSRGSERMRAYVGGSERLRLIHALETGG